MKGSTKSGATFGIGPGIDYSFHFTGRPDNARVEGCHDGYPSYYIYVNDKRIYYHRHKKINLISLFGKCDTKVSVPFTYPK